MQLVFACELFPKCSKITPKYKAQLTFAKAVLGLLKRDGMGKTDFRKLIYAEFWLFSKWILLKLH